MNTLENTLSTIFDKTHQDIIETIDRIQAELEAIRAELHKLHNADLIPLGE